jgi:endonuclease YncB( thermonuclease family)
MILAKSAAASLLAIGLAAATTAAAQAPREITGRARAVNADTIAVDGTYVFLWGIESMERNQMCVKDGVPWACYDYSVRALETIIDVAAVTCALVGEPDYLGRSLGTCTVAGRNVNETLVRQGFAFAKRDETLDYVAAEEAAKAENLGLWAANFQMPAEHRAAEGIFLDRP